MSEIFSYIVMEIVIQSSIFTALSAATATTATAASTTASAANIKNKTLDHCAAKALFGPILKVAYRLKEFIYVSR